tara:strand:+ start:3211 stop:3543 length:333 start_codon:yes stop_codon:yes gene_type:complete
MTFTRYFVILVKRRKVRRMTDYRLTCCGHSYKEGDDLFRGMTVISCPTCGAMNPPGVLEEEYLESLVDCVDCDMTIGTEKEVYDEESVEWYNIDGLVYCPSCKNKLEVKE